MEANPNIEVNLMHIPSEDFLTKLNAMIAAGEAPDVSYSASWKCQMVELLHLGENSGNYSESLFFLL